MQSDNHKGNLKHLHHYDNRIESEWRNSENKRTNCVKKSRIEGSEEAKIRTLSEPANKRVKHHQSEKDNPYYL